MQTNKKKKNAKVTPVSKPYMKGAAFDSTCPRSSLLIFGGTVLMMVAFLLIGGMMMWDNLVLRIITNGVLLLGAYMIFYYSGAGRGSIAVNQGEIMYKRTQIGGSMTEEERARCFHPAKGFLTGLLGCVPLLVCAIILACVAKRQMVTAGALPSWISSLMTRDEIGNALAPYQTIRGMDVEDVMRVIIRMCIMPLVNIIGSSNSGALLLAERLSPILMLLPGLSYGLGYLRGVSIRTQVHTDIAQNKRKSARKAKRQRKARQAKGPEQLN